MGSVPYFRNFSYRLLNIFGNVGKETGVNADTKKGGKPKKQKNQYGIPGFSIDNLVCCPRNPTYRIDQDQRFLGEYLWTSTPL